MKLDPHKLALEKIAAEQGDSEPLSINPAEINRDHELVDHEVQISDYAADDHQQACAKVTGVVLSGNQVAAVEVEIDGERHLLPKKDIWIDQKYVEDIHLDTQLAQRIREVLKHWMVQRDYYGPSWDGIEAFNFRLAMACKVAHVEAAGWYKYTTSLRSDMDGKDWRLCVPDDDGWVAVNCHSLLHDAVWTLSTTVYSSREIFGAKPAGSDDHWHRTLMWTLAVAKALATDGFTYDDVIKNFIWRLSQIPELRRQAREILPGVIEAYQKVTGEGAPRLPGFSIGMSHVRLLPNTVSRHEPPDHNHSESIITVMPEVASDVEYLRYVVMHEMIHYVLGDFCGSESHGDLFNDIAGKIGLPVEHRE